MCMQSLIDVCDNFQLANIYMCTPSFVAYLDWQRCSPDWLLSLRTTGDRFV